VVTVAAATDVVTAGASPQFRISANPAPLADLAVTVTITAPGCVLAQSSASVPIAAGASHATLTVPTGGVAAGANGCVVTATIAAGDGYAVGAAGGASASVTLTMQPVVTVTADSATVTEGSPVSFTLTAAPPPAGDLAVTVSWSESGSFLAATSPRTVTIAASAQTAPLTAATVDDSDPEADGSVTVTVEAGSGYTVGASGSATVDVTDNDTTGTASPGPTAPGVVPQVTIAGLDTAVTEGKPVRFKLTATPAPASALTVNVQWKDPGGYLSGTPPQTATISPSGTSELAADTDDDTEAAADRFVRVTVMAGSGYVAGASAKIRVEDNDTPRVTVTALNHESYDHDTITLPPVYEGGTISFTLTANPKPAAALTVAMAWHLAGDIRPPTTPYRVRLPTTGTASVSMAAGDDDKDNAYDTRVGVHLQSGAGYRLGAPNRAYIWIVNND